MTTEELYQLYQTGHSVRSLATQFGIHPQTLFSRLRKGGYKLRPQQEACALSWSHLSGERKAAILARLESYRPQYAEWSAEKIAKRVASRRGYKHSPLTRQRLRDAWTAKTPEIRQLHARKVSLAKRGRPMSDEHLSKVLKAIYAAPNKAERSLLELMTRTGILFQFCGNGAVVIGGKCPDYIHLEEQILIELFGDHWHKESEVDSRIAHFRGFGYETLIIWDHELKDPTSTTTKIQQFVGACMKQGKNMKTCATEYKSDQGAKLYRKLF